MATDPPLVPSLSRGKKFLLTACIYFCYLVFGIAGNMIGPARLDIADLIGVNFMTVSYGAVSKSAGYASGALVACFLFPRINRQLGLVTSLIASGSFMMLAPFVKILWFYLTSELAYGFMNAGIDTGCNAWILEIWQESANPYMQGLHFSYALGQTIAPLVTEPFLSPDQSENRTMAFKTNGLLGNGTSRQETRIVIPYSIGAASLILAGIIILCLYFKVPYVDPKRTVSRTEKEKDVNMNSTISKSEADADEKRYFLQIIALGCLLLCCYAGLETSTFNFMPEFAVVMALKLTKSKAAFLTSVSSGAFAANRFASIFVASKIRVKTMLYASFLVVVTGNVILLTLANTSETMLWIAVVLIGAGHSSIYPCFMSFLEQRMNVTTSVCALFVFSSVSSSIILPIVVGNYVEKYPLTYVYINVVLLTVCFAVFAILWFIDKRFRRKRRAQNLL